MILRQLLLKLGEGGPALQHLVHAAGSAAGGAGPGKLAMSALQCRVCGSLPGGLGRPGTRQFDLRSAPQSTYAAQGHYWLAAAAYLLPLPPSRARRCYSSHPCTARTIGAKARPLSLRAEPFETRPQGCSPTQHPPCFKVCPAWLRLMCTNTRPARVICLQLERRAEQLAAAAAERKRLEAEVAELKAAQQAQQGGGEEEDEEGAAAAAEVIAVLKQQLQAAQAAAAKVGGWRAGLCKRTVSGH